MVKKTYIAPSVDHANKFVRVYEDIGTPEGDKPLELKSVVTGYKIEYDAEDTSCKSFIQKLGSDKWYPSKESKTSDIQKQLSQEVSIGNLVEKSDHSDSEFLNCPFCGNHPKVTTREDEERDYIRMSISCCVSMNTGLSYSKYHIMDERMLYRHLREILLSDWNRRHDDNPWRNILEEGLPKGYNRLFVCSGHNPEFKRVSILTHIDDERVTLRDYDITHWKYLPELP